LEYLSVEVINRLGLTIEEFKLMSLKKPNNMGEYINLPSEVVVAKVEKDLEILNLESIENFPVKKDTYLFLRMSNFIKLFNKGHILPTSIFKQVYKPYTGQDLNNKHLLVWVFNAGIGDIVFQLTVLRLLKIKFPRLYITYAVPKDYIEFIKSINIVDNVIINIFEAKLLLTSDYHLHFEGLIRSGLGEHTNIYKLLAERVYLNNTLEELYPQFPPNPIYRKVWEIELKNRNIDEFIIINFNSNNPMRGASSNFKNKLLDKFKEKIIVFIDHPRNSYNIDKLIKGRDNCYNFSDLSKNLIQSVSLLSLAKLVISVDTGLIHLAAAVGTPTFGIYGPFPGELRVLSYPNSKFINGLCRLNKSCMEHDKFKCDYWNIDGPECYDNIDLCF
jgi:ADP-heptose:LPS heptosyltransferase